MTDSNKDIIDTVLYTNEWISLRKISVPSRSIRGHVYSTETRCDGQIIAILPFRITSKGIEYLLRKEVTPCWHPTEPILSAITGGVEKKNAMMTAVHELKEETGYTIRTKKLIWLGMSYASKSADTRYHLYSVNLTGKKQGEATGEDSTPETHNTSVWMNEEVLRLCYDPQVSVMLLRLKERLRI